MKNNNENEENQENDFVFEKYNENDRKSNGKKKKRKLLGPSSDSDE